MKLNIGCGRDIRKGWVNLDKDSKIGGVNVNHDLNEIPLPFKENSCVEILCSHVLEHFSFKHIVRLMNEFHRILKKEGTLVIKVPYYNSNDSHIPIDHVTMFGFCSMDFFEGDYINHYKIKKWIVVKEEGTPSFFGRLVPNIPLKKWVHHKFAGSKTKTVRLRDYFSQVFGNVYCEISYELRKK